MAMLFTKIYLWNVFLFDLAVKYEILPGKGDNTCYEIVKEEYFTIVRLES